MGIQLELGLREKVDRDGRTFLFGSIPEYNLVVFVYDDTDGRHTLRVKPYRPRKVAPLPDLKGQAPPDDEDPWSD